MKISRGALIVVEGCDRAGKTTVCKNIVSTLVSREISAEYMNFPDRSTKIGQCIDQYLSSKVNLSDETIHLLFSANRWERENTLKKKLLSGITLVVDRYAFSGVAFSAAKGMDIEWCKSSDRGLPKPDKIFLLTLSLDALQARKGFGEERYEQTEFQSKVMDSYQKLKDDTWEEVDADRTQDELRDYLSNKIEDCQKDIPGNIDRLWID